MPPAYFCRQNPEAEALDDTTLLGQVQGKRGRPKKGEENLALQGLKYGTRAHWLARLDRDGHAELAAQVRAGTISANAAAIEAGFRKPSKLTRGHQPEGWLYPSGNIKTSGPAWRPFPALASEGRPRDGEVQRTACLWGKNGFVEVAVEQQDIAAALERNSSHCTVTGAIARCICDAKHVAVDLQTIRFTRKGLRYVFLTPHVAQDAIVARASAPS